MKRNLLPFLVLPAFLLATSLPLRAAVSIDSDGWTVITPSADSRIIYVSSSQGDNSYNGLSPSTPKKTITAGSALVRDGFPDHLLLKRGDVFPAESSNILNRWTNGRSAQEPVVFSYYGDEGARPVVKITGSFINHNGQVRDYQAFIGIEVYKSNSDPESVDFTNAGGSNGMRFVGGGRNILVEDCHLRFIETTVQGYEGGNYRDFRFRRNIVTDAWVHNSSIQNQRISGIFISGARDSYLLEENFFDHNGWNETVANAGANMYNHNAYVQYSNVAGGIIRGNIFARGSSHGLQARSGGVVERNLFVLNAISAGIGGEAAPTQPGVAEFDNRMYQNVVLNGRRMDPNDGNFPRTTAVWGLTTAFFHSTLEDNIIANRAHSGNNRAIHTAGPSGSEGSYTLINNTVYRWDSQFDTNNPSWTDPDADLGDYYASVGGSNDTVAYLNWLRNRPVGTFPWDMTAYAAINYIRAGFNKPALDDEEEEEEEDEFSWVNDDPRLPGWLYASESPWVYSDLLQDWVFMPENQNESTSTWFFMGTDSISYEPFQLIEDFDSYITGEGLHEKGSWSERTGSGDESVIGTAGAFTVVEMDGNQVVQVNAANTTVTFANMELPVDAQIASGDSGTYFFQMSYAEDTGVYNGNSIGVAGGIVDAFGTQGGYILPGPNATTASNLRGFHGDGSGAGSVQIIAGSGTSTPLPAAGTWINIWMVVNHNSTANATVSVYLNTGADGATEANRVATNLGFRNSTGSNSVDHFYLSDFAEVGKVFHIDNIHFSPGTNLGHPDAMITEETEDNTFGFPGWIHDTGVSWLYSGLLNAWIYAPEEGTRPSGGWFLIQH